MPAAGTLNRKVPRVPAIAAMGPATATVSFRTRSSRGGPGSPPVRLLPGATVRRRPPEPVGFDRPLRAGRREGGRPGRRLYRVTVALPRIPWTVKPFSDLITRAPQSGVMVIGIGSGEAGTTSVTTQQRLTASPGA